MEEPPVNVSCEERAQVQKLIETCMYGYAKVRLARLGTRVLEELVRQCRTPGEPPPEGGSIDEKVAYVLRAKKHLQRLAKQTPQPPAAAPAADVSEPQPAAASQSPSRRSERLARQRPVFQDAHEINIIAFNSLKLRLDHEDLKDEWDAAVLEFAKYDVLMLSEVRAGDRHYKTRVLRLIEMLDDCTDDRWTWRMSEPSNGEVHLLVVKRPIDIVAVTTLHRIESQGLDYAPLVAWIDDLRFAGELRRFCLTSLHAPPNSGSARRSQRDAQLGKLISAYPIEASLRFNLPFTDQAAKEMGKKSAHPYVAHIIAGDFNASASELRELGAEKHGFEIVFGNVRTSSGGKAYDNFLVNRDCKNHLTLGADVLNLARFANFSRGQQGLSDHAPVALRLTEMPRAM